MEKKPFFSIITVSFNSEKTIQKTIESVLHQSEKDYEYIIIDGGSTDSTVACIQRYEALFDGRLSWVSEKDDGIYYAMNKGLARANGNFVGIINSDDWYEPHALEIVKSSCGEDAQLIYGLLRYWQDGVPFKVEGFSQNQLAAGLFIHHPTCFIKKTVYDEWGGYDEKYRSAADLELLLRYSKEGVNFLMLDRVLANFSSGGLSSEVSSCFETLQIQQKYGIISPLRRLYKAAFICLDYCRYRVAKKIR